MEQKQFELEFVKSDALDHGILIGWAIVCKQDGEDYFDRQDDHIPEDSMFKAATDFFKTGRVLKDMHEGDKQGTVVFGLPATEDVLKSLGLESNRTGLIVGVAPNEELLKMARKGERCGFSIGGRRIQDEEVE